MFVWVHVSWIFFQNYSCFLHYRMFSVCVQAVYLINLSSKIWICLDAVWILAVKMVCSELNSIEKFQNWVLYLHFNINFKYTLDLSSNILGSHHTLPDWFEQSNFVCVERRRTKRKTTHTQEIIFEWWTSCIALLISNCIEQRKQRYTCTNKSAACSYCFYLKEGAISTLSRK